MKNEMYLLYRRVKGLGNSILFILMRVFPIKRKKIVFTSIEGQSGYSCNPRYIAEEILNEGLPYDLYWLVNDMSKPFPKQIKVVKNNIWNRAYHLTTADVWIDNSRKPLGTLKRKKQMYIQTWHATLGFKPAGKLRQSFPKIAYLISTKDSRMADYVLTNSKWCDDLYEDMIFTVGNTLRGGSPRCDILVNKQQKDSQYKLIRKKYNIPSDYKIVMYAPTFRGGGQQNVRRVYEEEYSLGYAGLVDKLKEYWGGNWVVLLRLHPQLADSHKCVNKENLVIDVSKEPDMNSILAACDLMITDYSSAAFDACYAYIPVLLYADDIKEYTKDRGKLLWELDELPFTISDSNEELYKNIKDFDYEEYKEKIREMLEKEEVFEDGNASKRVVKIISEHVDRRKG